MPPESNADQDLNTYVASLVGIGGQLTSILQHMYARSQPGDDPSPNAVLTDLLHSILEEPAADCSPSDLRAAARIVELTSATIADELFLVSDELMDEWKREARVARSARRKLPMRPRRPL